MNGCEYSSGTDKIMTLSCIFPIIANLIYWAIGMAGTIALFMIIFAGYQFLFSGGDAKSVDGARKTLTYAILGLVLIFLSFFILNFIATVTGVGCLNFSHGFPTSFSACK
jgi:hypothetical protein